MSADEATPSPPKEGPSNFEFVRNDDQRLQQVRSHAMRVSWRGRKSTQANVNKGPSGARLLAPRLSAERGFGNSEEVHASTSSASSQTTPSTHSPSRLWVGDPVQEDEVEELDERYDKIVLRPFDLKTSGAQLEYQYSPKYSGVVIQQPVLASSVGSGFLDGLSSVPYEIEAHDTEIIHHWFKEFPRIMYGVNAGAEVTDPWIQLEFSNEASFHGAMAYSAAHLSLIQRQPMSTLAIKHHMKAIKIINQWLTDPVLMISDAAIAAVLRLTSLENWWGNEESVKIHRAGLSRMIELRGGLFALGTNWRLEKACHSILLVKEPYWFCPERHQHQVSPRPPQYTANASTASDILSGLCRNFVKHFKDLRAFRIMDSENTGIMDGHLYPSIRKAISHLQLFARYPIGETFAPSSYSHIEETIRLVTAFYLAMLWRDNLLFPGTEMKEMEIALKENEWVWAGSIESLFNTILIGRGAALTSPTRCYSVLQLMDVARLLNFKSWTGVKRTLFRLLLGGSIEEIHKICWDEDLLYEEVRGRY